MAQLPLFKDFDGYSPKYHFFKNSLLGQVHDSIPWDDLVSCLPEERSGRGAPSWFGAKGMFAPEDRDIGSYVSEVLSEY